MSIIKNLSKNSGPFWNYVKNMKGNLDLCLNLRAQFVILIYIKGKIYLRSKSVIFMSFSTIYTSVIYTDLLISTDSDGVCLTNV